MCVKYFWRKKKNLNLRLFNYCAKFRCLRNCHSLYWCKYENRKPNISMRTVRTYITYFEIYFYVGLATLIRGITAQRCGMRADYVTRWLLSVLSQCRALTLDFYLFRELMIALLIMYRRGCVICLECIIKKRRCSFMCCFNFHVKNKLRWLMRNKSGVASRVYIFN